MIVPKLRVGVVGLGYWGPNLVRNFHDVPDVERSLDLRPQRRIGSSTSVAGTLRSGARPDFGDLLSDDRLDAIAIATPVGTHYSLALQRSRAASTSSSRSRSPHRGGGFSPRRDGGGAGADTHARPYVPLQPTREPDPRSDRVGRAR